MCIVGIAMLTIAEPGDCDIPLAPPDDWLESQVIAGFRVWQILFLGVAACATIVVVLCCIFRCRIPRTKQEIEADFARRRITRMFKDHLDHIQMEELDSLLPVLKRVEIMEQNRASKPDEERVTWITRVKRVFVKVENKEEKEEKVDEDARMRAVETEVENAKIDSGAFSIFDHMTVLQFGRKKHDK